MAQTLVITHKDCYDGHTAAWIYSRFVDHAAEFLPVRYGDPVPEVAGRNVVIADFSWPREQMLGIIFRSKSLVVLDHHKTAQAALEGIVDEARGGTDPASAREILLSTHVVFDMERSGAGLVWDYLAVNRHGTCEECGASDALVGAHHQPGCVFLRRPALVDYVEDRDLWRIALPNAREYMANVYATPMDFAGWDKLHERAVPEMVSRGQAILEYMAEYGTKGLAQARVMTLDTGGDPVTLWTVNMPYMNCSDYLSRLMTEKDVHVVAGYFRRDDGRWQFSLRSRDGYDCSKIAQAFGGGGHREASGFDVPALEGVLV
jgi:oligoribonuclease NrnB/cAMP/cGMP phosphodiesterase (DHH superfamily)